MNDIERYLFRLFKFTMETYDPSLSVQNFIPTMAGGEVTLPRMVEVRQIFPADQVSDVHQAVKEALAQFSHLELKGKRIAITAGSRGINGMIETLQAIVTQLLEWGAEPFLIPAMGSHGNASAEGQVAVLESLGITEASIGAPIDSSMEVVQMGTLENGTPICCDKLAFESDGIVVCNRIKAHTGFIGELESGLVKMMVIGLGKHISTEGIHRLGFAEFSHIIPQAAAVCLENAPIIFGVGIVENAYNQVARIEAMLPDSIVEREKDLLQYAKSIMGRLLVSEMDILVVDELGKDISGGGMDSNVTGRAASGLRRSNAPTIGSIIVRDLTKKTAGNSVGMGMADFMCKRAAEKVVLSSTYTNAITAGAIKGARLPIIVESDRAALSLAIRSGIGDPREAKRIVHIRNTKELDTIWISTAFLSEIADRDDILVMGDPRPYEFDDSGSMVWPTERRFYD
jgi:hypothetical protein